MVERGFEFHQEIKEQDTLRFGFDREFIVSVGDPHQYFNFFFYYRIDFDSVTLFGEPGTSYVRLTDESYDSYSAQRAYQALEVAKAHIKDLHPGASRFTIQPEILKIGADVAWDCRDLNALAENR